MYTDLQQSHLLPCQQQVVIIYTPHSTDKNPQTLRYKIITIQNTSAKQQQLTQRITYRV